MSETPITAELIQFPRSVTANAVPQPTILKEGTMAVNLKDKVIYSLDDQGNVIVIGKNYDEILAAHFSATNPHGTTKEDLGLGKVPDVDLREHYVIDPNESFVLDTPAVKTTVDYWSTSDVTMTVDNSKYSIGDEITVNRHANSAGLFTITLNTANNFLIRGALTTDVLEMHGGKEFSTTIKKISATTWIVRVVRI
jgi:excinuclease UvrABC ATPase subunit